MRGQFRVAQLGDKFILWLELYVLILVYLGLILNDGIASGTNFVDLASKIVFCKRWQLFVASFYVASPVSLHAYFSFANLLLYNEVGHIDVAVRGALNAFFVLCNIGHLSANHLGVNVRRNAQLVQAFH
jgi:hypothetical protein